MSLGLPTTTPTVITGHGRHLYFAHPGTPQPNRTGFMERVDVRGDGGMVVAPPSIHPTTSTQYEWADGLSLDDVPLAPLPDLPSLSGERQTESVSRSAVARPTLDDTDKWWALLEGLRLGRVDHAELLIGEGRRNSQLTRIAGKARRCGYLDHEIADRIHHLNDALCQPPMATVEVERILRNARRFPRGDTRSRLRWLRECAIRTAATGRSAMTLLRVLDAHLDIACSVARTTYTASVREIAVRANVTAGTACKRQFDLMNAGILLRDCVGAGIRGSRWRISPTARAQLDTLTKPLSGSGTQPPASSGH